MAIAQRFLGLGLLLLTTLATGLWLGQLGRPVNMPLSTLHKLLALAWVVFTAIRIFREAGDLEARNPLLIAAAVMALSVIALFLTGALLTVPTIEPGAWLAIHRIATVTVVAAFAFSVRVLAEGKP